MGLLRHADGNVTPSGYSYLPTIHIDNDVRPAPIAPGDMPDVVGHVRLLMRDPDGARQVGTQNFASLPHIDVCPRLTFDTAPDVPVGGDFAQHIATLGSGVTQHTPAEFIAVFGYPLGSAAEEPGANCAGTTHVLRTERRAKG